MAVTIYDVAEAAGVSIATVSKALNDSYTIPETTKEAIRATAERPRQEFCPSGQRHHSLSDGFLPEYRL